MHGIAPEKAVTTRVERPHGRFTTLDGMRGVAALVVVWFHMSGFHWATSAPLGYLAVDMFFMLSGFVIAHANDRRFEAGFGIREFLLRRVIRLYPMYVLGLLLGLATFQILHGKHYSVISFVLNAFLIPAVHTPRPHVLFPLDTPAWSLMCEFYIANVLYAVGFRWFHKRTLIALIAISAVLLIACQHYNHSLMRGDWLSTLPMSFARTVFSFFYGVLLARLHAVRKPKLPVPTWLILSILAVALLLPVPYGSSLTGVFEAIYVAFLFPALIYWGAEARSRTPKVGQLLGDASYAVYLIHVPVVGLLAFVAAKSGYHVSTPSALLVEVGLFALALLFDAFYDLPVRRWLLAALRKPRAITQS